MPSIMCSCQPVQIQLPVERTPRQAVLDIHCGSDITRASSMLLEDQSRYKTSYDGLLESKLTSHK